MPASFVPPVFFKANEVLNYLTLTEYDVYTSVKTTVGDDNVVGCQRIGGLWRIYLKTIEVRIKLLASRLNIRGQLIGIYDDNPFRTGLNSPDDKVIKLTIKDYPLSKENSAIESYLQSQGLALTRPVQYAQIRNPDTKELTSCYSGDRIAYTKPFQKDLPRIVYIGNTRVRLFYQGQPKEQREMLCTNCFGTDHYKSRCNNSTVCKKCRSPDHETGNAKCDAPRNEPYKKTTVFQGRSDVFSNYYMCEINCHGITAKSSEHSYQYVKAIRRGCLDVAKLIKEAPTAHLAKQAAKRLPYNANWKNEKLSVMKDILDQKCKQVPEFRDALINSKSNKLVEAVAGEYFWSSGLNKEDTLNTKNKYWFGQNRMGALLTEIRNSLRDGFQQQSSQGSRKNKPTSLQTTANESKLGGNQESDYE